MSLVNTFVTNHLVGCHVNLLEKKNTLFLAVFKDPAQLVVMHRLIGK